MVMTQDILPALKGLSPAPKQLLWIGVQPYTLRYQYLLGDLDIQVTTLEVDQGQAVYGSSDHHIIGPAQECDKHFEHEFFDVVRAPDQLEVGNEQPICLQAEPKRSL